MAKPRLIAVIPVLFILNGAFLIIYGFVTGADFRAVFIAFASRGVNYPLSAKEFYVGIGVGRILFARFAMIAADTRGLMIFWGIFLVFTSIAGVGYGIIIRGITASNVYVIAIDFIVMFTLSLIYLRYAVKLPKEL